MKQTIKIASRQSKLALWQANSVKEQLQLQFPTVKFEILGLNTAGDKEQSQPLQDIGGKALFVKALQQALLDGVADCAVHCIKDMSVQPTPQLSIASLLKRHDPRDVLVCPHTCSLETLAADAVIGTSSPRRASLLKRARPDLQIKPIRGNINTRLDKLLGGEFDAIVLAAAGLLRLDLTDHIQQYFNTATFIPAIGQGALGIECRQQDARVMTMLQALNDRETAYCVEAEQTVNRILGGDCHAAIGAYAQVHNNTLSLTAMVASHDGQDYIEASAQGACNTPAELGQQVAAQLIAQGAKQILSSNQPQD